jgi:hypothetical protein
VIGARSSLGAILTLLPPTIVLSSSKQQTVGSKSLKDAVTEDAHSLLSSPISMGRLLVARLVPEFQGPEWNSDVETWKALQ